MEFKDLKEAGEYIDKLEKERMYNRSDVTNLIKGVSAVSAQLDSGVVNSGDAGTDTVINSLRSVLGSVVTSLNKLVENIGKQ